MKGYIITTGIWTLVKLGSGSKGREAIHNYHIKGRGVQFELTYQELGAL